MRLRKKLECSAEKLFLGLSVYRPILNNKSLLADWRAANSYRIIEKNFSALIDSKSEEVILEESSFVWICWFQGMNQAPEIVKKCVASVEAHLQDKEIVVITEENLKQYVHLPEFILEKWAQGIISNAHFSDILRADLLSNYGGIWIDATVLLTQSLATEIEEADFFAYQTSFDENPQNPILISSWFLKAKKNHPIITETRKILIAYWQKHQVLMNYYLFHIIISLVIRKFPSLWNSVKKETNGNAHLLQFQLNNEFSAAEFNRLKQLVGIHKLTYKGLTLKSNTFAKVIIDSKEES